MIDNNFMSKSCFDKVDFFAGLWVLRETALRRFWTALKKIATAKPLLDGADWTALKKGERKLQRRSLCKTEPKSPSGRR